MNKKTKTQLWNQDPRVVPKERGDDAENLK